MNFMYSVLCLVAAVFTVSQAVDIKTYPPLDTFIIPASALFLDTFSTLESVLPLLNIKCFGDEPVTWIAPNQAYNSSVTILNQEVNNTFTSILTLKNATYLDTGVYTCKPILKVKKQDSKRIFIFVGDNTHLLMPPTQMLQEIIGEEFDNVTIPCISTSISGKPLLLKKDKVISHNMSHEGMADLKYNPRFGFSLKKVTENSSGLYRCIAVTRNYGVNLVLYKMIILPIMKKIVIKKKNPDLVVIGNNVSVECSVNMDLSIPFSLNWVVPHPSKHQDERININKMNYVSYLNNRVNRSVGSRLLDIQNVTYDDDGVYICELIVNSERIHYSTYALKVDSYRPTNYYLHLALKNGVSEILSKTGTSEVEFIIMVAAHPEPTLTWRSPDGVELESSEKILIVNNNKSSKLIIKNLELFDTGTYELIADNLVHEKKIAVTLLVESAPIIKHILNPPLPPESLYNNYYGCEIYGYPLPDFDLVFKSHTNLINSEESNVEIKSSFTKVSFYRKLVHKVITYIINLNTTESGLLMCQASNMFGITNTSFEIVGDK